MKLRWSKDYPPGFRFDWGPDVKIGIGTWWYAHRGPVAIALVWFEDGQTEIDIVPIELGYYAWEGRCKSLEAAKAKAVQLVQQSLKRAAKAWGVI